MLQLNACLLLFIITTDKTLALLHHRCHEHIDLSQEPMGHIGLTPEEVSDTPRTGLMVCRRTLEIPAGHAVLLKLVELEEGSDMSLLCVLGEKARALQLGEAALLSGCDQNKATLTWSGAGHSSNAFQLCYYVQEDDRNTTEASASPRSDHSIVTQSASTAKDLHFTERVDSDSSVPSAHDPGLTQPTTPLPGTGSTDREALLFPEEGLNNGADTPGAPHRTDSPGTQDYFHTQHSSSTHSAFRTLQIANTQTISELSTDRDVYRSSRTLELGEKRDLASSSIIPVSVSGIGSTALPHNAPVSGTMDKKIQDSTKNWQSTSTLVSGSPDSPRTQGYFHTQNSTSAKFQTLPNTQSISELTESTSSSRTFLSTDRDFLTTSSTLELREKLLSSSRSTTLTDPEIGSTEIPHITTKSGVTENKTQDSTQSEQSVGTQGSGQTTAVTFDPLNSSSAPTQESISTASTPLSSSLGTSSASLVPDWDAAFGRTVQPHITEIELATTQASITTDLFTSHSFTSPSSSDSTFGETSKEEAKTEGTQRNVLTTISYFSDQTIDNERTTSFTTKPSSTASLGDVVLDDRGTTAHLETVRPNEKSVEGLSTGSPSTTSAQQTFRKHDESTVVYSEIFPTTESSRRTSAVSKKAMPTASQIPYQGQSSKYESLSSPTVTHTGQREAEKRGTTAIPSWTQEPSRLTNTFTQPHKYLSSATIRSSTVHHKPKFYIVPDEPAIIRVESIELLLQIIVEESRSSLTAGLEEDTALWLEPYLQRAPGFKGLLGVWSSGHAVQCLVEFNTRGALQWLNHTGISSLLEQTGLSQAVREGRSFRSASISNITLGGLQGDVCGWLLQCPSGFTCVFNPHTSNYSCTSVCHSDYCHHHGLCTHHPAQPPVCRCLAGEDFWFLGQRCDVRMTRARLVVTCLAVLLIVVAVIGVLAFVAVRRYRALLIQAKVDQTRSSYRRFNHFDELSGRFWLRSWAGSADSLDNPAFTRSDELLHLRALERPCCYHDDTMSLPSTCPSPGTHIRTIYPHSSQYAWRGSDMSMGDGVLDSGKASDLSVCSWPVEPIQWTPFPLLRQLSTQRSPAVRVSRPRSYCEGMELVDMGKSWTA